MTEILISPADLWEGGIRWGVEEPGWPTGPSHPRGQYGDPAEWSALPLGALQRLVRRALLTHRMQS